MPTDTPLRSLLRKALAWEDAHVSFDKAVDGIPPDLRGKQPSGAPYSPWQLLEHVRITQHDVLDFCVNAGYQEVKWPDAYWPPAAAPPSAAAWDDSVSRVREDRKALEALAANSDIDLSARIPHGSGQTYMRELVLVIDHSAYHVGQLVLVRRLLGAWE
jgi:uncharacterized damage-inducible protein DinB